MPSAAPEIQEAGDPTLTVERADYLAPVIVQCPSTISHEGSTCRGGENDSVGVDAVLQRHPEGSSTPFSHGAPYFLALRDHRRRRIWTESEIEDRDIVSNFANWPWMERGPLQLSSGIHGTSSVGAGSIEHGKKAPAARDFYFCGTK